MRKLKKVEIAIILLIVISIIVIVPSTFTMYKESAQVSLSTKSGELVYDVILDDNSTYMDNDRNTPYFLVTVKNNKDNFLTDVNFDYELVIKNKTGDSGLFSYIDSNNNETTPASTLTISGTMGKTLNENRTFRVYIYSNQSSETTVDYDVDYEISQKKMD